MRLVSLATYIALTSQVKIRDGDGDGLDYVPHGSDREPESTTQ